MKDLDLLVTLWPTFSHFKDFIHDDRVGGVRLNSAMVSGDELNDELKTAKASGTKKPIYFDIKGRQLRVTDVFPYNSHLELRLNHPIEVATPTPVLFKAGEDGALLSEIKDDGYRLVFDGGPDYMVNVGESLHIRDPSLSVGGNLLTKLEIDKIFKAKKAGFEHFCLSYAESQKDIDEFRFFVGKDAFVYAKIENKKGLHYVETEFRKQDNLGLLAACGDLYVELDRPHQILNAVKTIVEHDPDAVAGSRMLLSMIDREVPSYADLGQLAWLYDVGYRHMMLCDELCLHGDKLGRAVSVFDSFREDYAKEVAIKDEPFYKRFSLPFNKLSR